MFFPPVSSHFVKTGKSTCAYDAAHCDGVRSQLYVTSFVVV